MPDVATDCALVDRLRAIGDARYHDKHPFHRRLVEGSLDADAVRAWVANRYYYQKQIPVKDALIVAKLPSAAYRRIWVQRIIDHDGDDLRIGGTEKWLALAQAVGLDPSEVRSESLVAPGARFAVDAYVEFARSRPWLEAVASSLTELFGPPVMQNRVAAILANYPWVDPAGLAYFEDRIVLAPRDAQNALGWVIEHALTREQQDACVRALDFKCNVLWSLLDATALQCGVFGER
jgi:pyrroloquinoline-quinone synthase